MARARNIKPGFFKNEHLAAAGLDGRLLFAGLWTLADREGRLENRPERIKAEVFPYSVDHVVDVVKLLNLLQDKGFILLYRVGVVDYIQILKFSEHQKPHKKEVASRIPAPEIPGQAEKKPEPTGLIPDSLNLIPDSPIPTTPLVASLPEWLPIKTWNEYLAMRKKKDSPHAHELLIKELDALRTRGHPPKEVLEQSIMQGWQGIFELKKEKRSDQKPHNPGVYRPEVKVMQECWGCKKKFDFEAREGLFCTDECEARHEAKKTQAAKS